MRRIAYVFAWLAAAGAGTYVVIYLYRWQWQRAVLCGVLLLVVEVMLLGIMLIGRLSRIEEQMRETQEQVRESGRRQQDVLARLRESPARQGAGRFRWLDEPAERTYVFVPVLMVTGVLLSGLAWLVQRVASVTAKPAERRLAGRLAVLAAPDPAADADLEDLPPAGGGVHRARSRGRRPSGSSGSHCSGRWSSDSLTSPRPASRRRTPTAGRPPSSSRSTCAAAARSSQRSGVPSPRTRSGNSAGTPPPCRSTARPSAISVTGCSPVWSGRRSQNTT